MIHKYLSFRELLEDKAVSSKEALVFLGASGNLSVTYSEFRDKVIAKKVQLNETDYSSLAILQNRSLDALVLFFASVLSGIRTLLIDPLEPMETIRAMLTAGEIESLFTDPALFDADEKNHLEEGLHPKTKTRSSAEGDILFFTSGTSGKSKAVVLTSASLLDSAYNGQNSLSCGEDDRILSILPLSHVFGFVCSFLWPFCYSATTIMGRGLRYQVEDVKTAKATILPLIPAQIGFLLSQQALNPEIRTLLVGAGPLPPQAIALLHQMGLKLAFGYGTTETSSGVALSVGGPDPLAMRPCLEEKFRIENDGTISIFSPAVMKGYFHDLEATSAVLKDGWFHTNDLGNIDGNGNLIVRGRLDDVLVLSNGTKVNANDAENIFAAALPKPFDFAFSVHNGNLILIAYLKNQTDSTILQTAVDSYNIKVPLSGRICGIHYVSSPLPRTKTLKLIRSHLSMKG